MSRRKKVDTKQGEEEGSFWSALLGFFRFLLFLIGLFSCLIAGFFLYGRWQMVQAGEPNGLLPTAATINPLEAAYLHSYLTNHIVALKAPLRSGATEVTLLVELGDTAPLIANKLKALGMLANEELFVNYVRYYGMDSQLEAGRFLIRSEMTIPELAQQLTHGKAEEVAIRFVEGWRAGEMGALLVEQRPAQIVPEQFMGMVNRQIPFDTSRYDFLDAVPANQSLEGFLFPDTYLVRADATAEELLNLMLENFDRRVTVEMRAGFQANGLSIFQAVILASIVEREAVVAVERPIIAAVFYNRLRQGIKLDADPTIQYSLGYQADTGSWWKSPLWQVDLDLDTPYNSYIHPGLPPGPIANPGLSSLKAVATPDQHEYLFFMANCIKGDGTHWFSQSYQEHVANVQQCR